VVSGIKSNASVLEKPGAHAVSLECLRPVPIPCLPARPSVSVLITCYNYGPYVGEAIESAINQTYSVSEIVVSDDGSSDNSCEVVESYVRRDHRIKLIRGEHGGMAACLNGAYAASSGDILCLLDADDVFLPRKVEAVVNAFRNHRGAGFCSHRALLMDHKGRRRGVYPLGTMPVGDCASDTFSNAGILMGLPPTTNLSLRREVAARLFPIPAEFTGYAEQMIHRLAPLMTKLSSADEPLAEWRQHGKNDQKATRVTLKRLDRELEIMMLLWQRQRDYLASVNPAAAAVLPGLEHSAYFRKLRYAQARLAGTAESAQRYQELFTSPVGGRKDIYFWRISKFLPRPLFSKALDLVMTQGVLKELIARLIAKRG
jgi:glycosyltransferase involved in cell wall biosynthesis